MPAQGHFPDVLVPASLTALLKVILRISCGHAVRAIRASASMQGYRTYAYSV